MSAIVITAFQHADDFSLAIDSHFTRALIPFRRRVNRAIGSHRQRGDVVLHPVWIRAAAIADPGCAIAAGQRFQPQMIDDPFGQFFVLLIAHHGHAHLQRGCIADPVALRWRDHHPVHAIAAPAGHEASSAPFQPQPDRLRLDRHGIGITPVHQPIGIPRQPAHPAFIDVDETEPALGFEGIPNHHPDPSAPASRQ